jgi:hypothetical protein
VALLTTTEAAKILGLNPVTVRAKAPSLPGAQRNEFGHWLLPESAIEELRVQRPRGYTNTKRRTGFLTGPAERALTLLGDWEQGTAEEIASATGVVAANARKALAIAGGKGLAARIEGTTSWTLTSQGRKWLVEHREVAA